MSIFSKFRAARKASKKGPQAGRPNGADAGSTDPDNTPPKVPYKHVVSHAAHDALSGAPSSWRVSDRAQIRKAHQRRSQIQMSRTSSYMTQAYPPFTPGLTPGESSGSSYTGFPWEERTAVRHHPMAGGSSSQHLNHLSFDSGIGRSVPGSKNPTRNGSSASSESSRLEMQIVHPRPHVHTFPEQNFANNLHQSTNRKLGEAPLYRGAPPQLKPTPKMEAAAAPKARKFGFGKRSNKGKELAVV